MPDNKPRCPKCYEDFSHNYCPMEFILDPSIPPELSALIPKWNKGMQEGFPVVDPDLVRTPPFVHGYWNEDGLFVTVPNHSDLETLGFGSQSQDGW